MAEEDKTKRSPDGDEAPRQHKGMHRIILLVAVVAVAGGAGFGAAMLLGGPQHAGADGDVGEDDGVPPGGDAAYEYITDFAPVTVNLDVPNVNRYVRTTVAMAVKKGKLDEVKKIITDRTPHLTSKLTVYLSGLTLDDVRGVEKLNKIRNDIRDMFNNELWPNVKPQIDHILLIEFKVQ